MSVFDVVQQRGTWVLVKFAAAVGFFLLLHIIRIPLVLAAKVLEIAMRRADAAATRVATTAPAGPVNQFFPPHPREEVPNAHA